MRTVIVKIAGVVFRWRIRRFGVIKDACVIVRKVPAIYVVDESVAVVVNVVAWSLCSVGPNIVVQVLVINVDSGVDNSDYNAAAACRDGPRLLGANVVAGESGLSAKTNALPGVVEPPHFRISRIVGNDQRSADEVRFGIDDIGPRAKCFDGIGGVGRIDLHDAQSFDNLAGRADRFNRQRNLPSGLLGHYLAAQLPRLRLRTKTNQNLTRFRVEILLPGFLNLRPLRFLSDWKNCDECEKYRQQK